ncbi:Unknown protein, partial [Striga hermonthica]
LPVNLRVHAPARLPISLSISSSGELPHVVAVKSPYPGVVVGGSRPSSLRVLF